MSRRLCPNSPSGWAVLAFCETAGKKYDAAIPTTSAPSPRRTASPSPTRAWASATPAPTGPATPSRRSKPPSPCCRRITSPRPNSATAICGRASPADGVRRSCGQAVSLRPGLSKGWDLLGLWPTAQAGQEARGASTAFQQAVKTGPDNADARTHLAEDRRRAGPRLITPSRAAWRPARRLAPPAPTAARTGSQSRPSANMASAASA